MRACEVICPSPISFPSPMQLVASVPRLSSLVIECGQVTAGGVRGLGQGVTRLRVCGAQVDQAAVGALASLTQLNSLQLQHIREAGDKPALKASWVPRTEM